MSELITKYFWAIFSIAMLLGIFLPVFSIFSPYILYMIMFVLFLSCLKININEIFKKIKNLKLVAYLTLLILILIPLMVYFIFNSFLNQEAILAILILAAMPAGMAVPAYATIFKGDVELALTLSILTSILCPFTIPFLMYTLVGIKTSINPFQMLINLGLIIFIPLFLSIILRKIKKNTINKTQKYFSQISILIIALIMAGALAKADVLNVIKNNPEIVYSFLSLFVLAILLQLIGWYAVYKKNTETKITSSLAIAYMNSTLAISFAAKFFSPEVLLIVTLYQIPTNLILIGFGYIIKKYYL